MLMVCLGTWATVPNEAYAEIGKIMAYSYGILLYYR